MNEILIEAPTGMEIYQENNTIKFRNIENKLPMSVEEISNRKWVVDARGKVDYSNACVSDKNNLSTKERAEAFLALMQLVELRDKWNGDWKADYTKNEIKYVICIVDTVIIKSTVQSLNTILSFKSEQLRDQFAQQFKDLIETAKELL